MTIDPRAAVVLLHLAAATTLVLIPWTHILGAVVLYIMVMPVVQLISHDYLSHLYMQPRNRAVEAVSLWIFCMLGGQVTEKISFHREHHRHWRRPDRDPTQRKISANNVWFYVLGLGRHVPHDFARQPHPGLAQSSVMRFFDRHAVWIRAVTVLAALALMPLEIVAVVFVLFPWMMLVAFNYHDWHFHGPGAGQDSWTWFLLFNTASWHHHHHRYPQQMYFGPGRWPWFNVSWYCYRTFFRPA